MLLLLFVEYTIETTILDFINIYTYVNHFLSMATLAEVNILAVRLFVTVGLTISKIWKCEWIAKAIAFPVHLRFTVSDISKLFFFVYAKNVKIDFRVTCNITPHS
jgi:hypothetical protein